MSAPTSRSNALDSGLLSFVAGFVDTVGFVGLFGLFTAHVTGNFVLIGAALIHPNNGLIAKLLALPVFLVAVALTTMYVGKGTPRSAKIVLASQMLLLAAFAIIGCYAAPIVDADAPLAIAAGLIGVTAMGVQNAASRLVFSDLPPTTVMTGNVTQFAADATHLLLGATSDERASMRSRLLKLGLPVATFGLGAIAGALAFRAFSFAALAIPIAALAVTLRRE